MTKENMFYGALTWHSESQNTRGLSEDSKTSRTPSRMAIAVVLTPVQSANMTVMKIKVGRQNFTSSEEKSSASGTDRKAEAAAPQLPTCSNHHRLYCRANSVGALIDALMGGRPLKMHVPEKCIKSPKGKFTM